MNKLTLIMAAVLASNAAYALPVGNPSDASLLCDGLLCEGYCGDLCDPCLTWWDALNVRIGFYGDYVFSNAMEVAGDATGHPRLDNTQLFTNAALITTNFWDRFDFFTTLGASSFSLNSNASVWGGASSARVRLESETRFSWSVGARGTIWECGCTTFGAEGQYFYTNPRIARIIGGGLDTINPDNGSHAKYREWQLGLGVSHRINIFVPYVAVRWGHSQLVLDDLLFDFANVPDSGRFQDCRNSQDWGYVIGVSLIDCEKVSLTVEGRFAGQSAFHVNGQIRF